MRAILLVRQKDAKLDPVNTAAEDQKKDLNSVLDLLRK